MKRKEKYILSIASEFRINYSVATRFEIVSIFIQSVVNMKLMGKIFKGRKEFWKRQVRDR